MKYLPLLILLLISDCKDRGVDPPPPPQKPVLTLSADDIGVTEVWLTLKTQNVTLPSAVTLLRSTAGSLAGNGDTLTTFTLTTSDTLLADTTAQPKQNYTYKAIVQNDTSNQLQVTTMDTSSHNFTWQTFTFGGEPGTGSSVLYDVAIINDTLAYAVGEIHTSETDRFDSTGKWIDQYNLLKWNGITWSLERISFPIYDFTCNTNNTYYGAARAVYAFDANNIVFTDGGAVVLWNGTTYSNYPCVVTKINGGIRKLWGTSPNDLYAVGTNGTIVHYNGSSWNKLESGTSATIQDIFGSTQTQIGEPLVLCSVSNLFDLGDMKILRLRNQTVEEYYNDPERRISSVWFKNENKIFRSGGGVFVRNHNRVWKEVTELPLYYTFRIRGTAANNVFVVAGFGLVAHYNGLNWQTFPEANQSDVYESCAYQSKTFIAVGTVGLKSVITVGKQQ